VLQYFILESVDNLYQVKGNQTILFYLVGIQDTCKPVAYKPVRGKAGWRGHATGLLITLTI